MYIAIYVVNLNINNIHDEGNGELIRDDVALIGMYCMQCTK